MTPTISLPSEAASWKGPVLHCYSDGGCRGNPGPGAFAYVIADSEQKIYVERSFFEQETTNNKMELKACISCLKRILHLQSEKKIDGHRIGLWTDSKYVCNGITQWIEQWKKRDWKTRDRKEVKNQDLWRIIDEIIQSIQVEFFWVKGHAGHEGNERCDELCNLIMDSKLGKR